MPRNFCSLVGMPRCGVSAACSGATSAFMVPMHDSKIIETLHEPPSERGCVEDQPQQRALHDRRLKNTGIPLPSGALRLVCCAHTAVSPCANRRSPNRQIVRRRATSRFGNLRYSRFGSLRLRRCVPHENVVETSELNSDIMRSSSPKPAVAMRVGVVWLDECFKHILNNPADT